MARTSKPRNLSLPLERRPGLSGPRDSPAGRDHGTSLPHAAPAMAAILAEPGGDGARRRGTQPRARSRYAAHATCRGPRFDPHCNPRPPTPPRSPYRARGLHGVLLPATATRERKWPPSRSRSRRHRCRKSRLLQAARSLVSRSDAQQICFFIGSRSTNLSQPLLPSQRDYNS